MDNQTISIRPWDRSNIHSIAKAITEEWLWLNPQTMADSIIIKFPLLTEERRKEIVKYAKWLLEDAKISIRNIRWEELKLIKWNKNFSEDKIKEEEYKLQNLINEYNNKVELLYENKIKDIMKI
jgi:ribosome recycling factor